MLFLVDREAGGALGQNRARPAVRSHRSSQEKPPWKDLPDLEGAVEADYLRPLLLGESIAPYRVLAASEAVIPWRSGVGQATDDGEAIGEVVTATGASGINATGLSRWLGQAEALWAKHGAGRISLYEQIDFYGKLANQFPVQPLRVVYAKSGSLPAAALVRNDRAVVENRLYWCPVATEQEGHYLCAVVNSATVRERTAHLQSQGQWGARDFDKVVWSLPIPAFDPDAVLHRQLAAAGAEAETLAAGLLLPPRFVAARQAIRSALAAAGVAQRIDDLVTRLLDGP
jgi:hypothetical protein